MSEQDLGELMQFVGNSHRKETEALESALTAANAEVERLRAKLVESREQVADWMLKANDNFWSATRLQAELSAARAERDAAREIVEAFKAWRAAWDTFHIETDSTRADWSGSRVNLASLKVSQTRQHLDALLVASLKGGK